jgi:hypothetical protein
VVGCSVVYLMVCVCVCVCVSRGEVDCPQELNEYEGFEIVYRSAAQVACIVNVTMENMTPEDVYQVCTALCVCVCVCVCVYGYVYA